MTTYNTLDYRVDQRTLALTLNHPEVGNGEESAQSLLKERVTDCPGNTSKMPPFYSWWK